MTLDALVEAILSGKAFSSSPNSVESTPSLVADLDLDLDVGPCKCATQKQAPEEPESSTVVQDEDNSDEEEMLDVKGYYCALSRGTS